MSYSAKSVMLVLLQFILLGYLIIGTGFSSYNAAGISLLIISVFVGLWAIIVMKQSKLSVFPDPSAGAQLIKKGPYQLIRHPMYTSVLLFSAGCITITYSIERLIAGILLLLVLLFKMQYEEQMLAKTFSEYENYMQETKRLVPYIY